MELSGIFLRETDNAGEDYDYVISHAQCACGRYGIGRQKVGCQCIEYRFECRGNHSLSKSFMCRSHLHMITQIPFGKTSNAGAFCNGQQPRRYRSSRVINKRLSTKGLLCAVKGAELAKIIRVDQPRIA